MKKIVYIYESPDGGKTIYRRKFMAPHHTRELLVLDIPINPN